MKRAKGFVTSGIETTRRKIKKKVPVNVGREIHRFKVYFETISRQTIRNAHIRESLKGYKNSVERARCRNERKTRGKASVIRERRNYKALLLLFTYWCDSSRTEDIRRNEFFDPFFLISASTSYENFFSVHSVQQLDSNESVGESEREEMETRETLDVVGPGRLCYLGYS